MEVRVGDGVEVAVDVRVTLAVGVGLESGIHEANIRVTSKTVTVFLIFIDYLVMHGTAQRLAIPSPFVNTDERVLSSRHRSGFYLY